MIYSVKLKNLDKLCENFADFSIENNDLYCFIAYSKISLEENRIYNVEIEYQIFNDYIVEEANIDKPIIFPFERIDDSPRYRITGRLNGNSFKSGNIYFMDNYLQKEYSFLDGRLITLTIDRLDISIISEDLL
ncbi:hypothetical protein CRG49_012830 [Neisseria sp. N95_16]|uniref:Uncharacterized protein n=1 Tax=Neisseria brasiliensis TaxID=2666100 RepID=A0A7X2GWV4_9NEIS|nr:MULTISPECIES: hypothetical protein [Neisseria]MRN37438.1 hypothetical protein [Neisseria brasiliensis]PJO08481.1 hypothetical protein CRG49_012830 [Neisseria sp. N95_16]